MSSAENTVYVAVPMLHAPTGILEGRAAQLQRSYNSLNRGVTVEILGLDKYGFSTVDECPFGDLKDDSGIDQIVSDLEGARGLLFCNTRPDDNHREGAVSNAIGAVAADLVTELSLKIGVRVAFSHEPELIRDDGITPGWGCRALGLSVPLFSRALFYSPDTFFAKEEDCSPEPHRVTRQEIMDLARAGHPGFADLDPGDDLSFAAGDAQLAAFALGRRGEPVPPWAREQLIAQGRLVSGRLYYGGGQSRGRPDATK